MTSTGRATYSRDERAGHPGRPGRRGSQSIVDYWTAGREQPAGWPGSRPTRAARRRTTAAAETPSQSPVGVAGSRSSSSSYVLIGQRESVLRRRPRSNGSSAGGGARRRNPIRRATDRADAGRARRRPIDPRGRPAAVTDGCVRAAATVAAVASPSVTSRAEAGPHRWGPASGVGSLPGTDPAEAVRLVVGELPEFAAPARAARSRAPGRT